MPLIHPDSFSRLGTSGCQFEFTGPHSSWVSNVSEQMRNKWRFAEKYYTSRAFRSDGYLHHLIFPNVTIVTLFGTTFSVQHFRPISPIETECSSHVFSTKLTEPSIGSAASAVIEGMNKASVEFNRVVFEEDRTICELAQRGVEENPIGKGVLGDEEQRVSEFQLAYTSAMTGEL